MLPRSTAAPLPKLIVPSAGSKDSALTNHGAQQASRLGSFFATSSIYFSHIFSSDKIRAVKTAEAIRAGPCQHREDALRADIIQVKELREQDFGYYEGKSFQAKKPNGWKNGPTRNEDRREDAEATSIETKESMAKRADTYLNTHLMHLLVETPPGKGSTIAVVSHGMLLSTLWRCILRRQSPSSVTLDPALMGYDRPVSLEHLGGWSNTGYLELELSNVSEVEPIQDGTTTPEQSTTSLSQAVELVTSMVEEEVKYTDDPIAVEPLKQPPSLDPSNPKAVSPPVPKFKILIKTINGKEHLKGLKRTGGGVGSSKHDEGQKSIESFFKRPKK